MNTRIDYKFKELVLRLLLRILTKLTSVDPNDDLQREAKFCAAECEAISDGRMNV